MIEDFSEAMCFMCHSSQHKEENIKESQKKMLIS